MKRSNLYNFQIVKKKPLSDHEAIKIKKVLVVKNENPPLNKNLFNKGSFFTSNIY